MQPYSLGSRLVWCLILLAAVTAWGCDLPLQTATEALSEVFRCGDAPVIVVETFNGPIDVSNGESDEVVVEVTKRSSGINQQVAEEGLERIEVSMVEKDNSVYITARRLGRGIGEAGASVVIAAPKNAKLSLKSSNGHIMCEGMQGRIGARTSNARIEVIEGTGTIDATTSNAAIDIEAADATIDAHTSNGRIRFKGSLAEAEQKFKTSNAHVDVTLPADSVFHLDSSTSNGRIDCEFAVEKKDRNSRKRLVGDVGANPKRSVNIATSNASVDIRKGS